MPWLVKILLKLILKRTHIPTRFWRKLGLFKHGGMHTNEYAIRIVNGHYDRVSRFLPQDFVFIELGPGDSAASAFILNSLGAKTSYLLDVDPCAVEDVKTYHDLMYALQNNNRYHIDKDLLSINSFSKMMGQINSKYLTNGLQDLKDIPSNSVDFIFSHAVLQHIFIDEFDEYLFHMQRVLKNSGIMSHRVDFRDCISAGLNNLRFNKNIWESHLFRTSGFYTNRLRYTEVLDRFLNAGFEIQEEILVKWDKLPLPIKKLSLEFQSRNDLLINTVDFILIKK